MSRQTGVQQRADGRWDAWHITDDRYLGSFVDEIEAMRASQKGTSVASLYEDMLRQNLFSDDDGNPLITAHRAMPSDMPDSVCERINAEIDAIFGHRFGRGDTRWKP